MWPYHMVPQRQVQIVLHVNMYYEKKHVFGSKYSV